MSATGQKLRYLLRRSWSEQMESLGLSARQMNKQGLKKHALMFCFAALSPTFAPRGGASSAPLCTSPVSPQLRASAKSEMDWRLPSGYHVLEINFPKAHLAIATPFENLATAQKHVPASQILAILENALIKRHCA
jgi:hypothetical protein